MSPLLRPYLLLATPLLLVGLVSGCSKTYPPAPASTCSPNPAANKGNYDITVTDILVTQAIQTTSPINSVPLVSQRSTVVRVMLDTGGKTAVSGVTGTLSVAVNGNPVSLGTHASPVNGSILAPLSPSWANECDTLNFEIPSPTGITASTSVKFHADITPVAGEKDNTNNSKEVTLAVTDRTTPWIYYTPIDFAGTGAPDPTLIQPGTGDSFVRGIYPINDSDPSLYKKASFPALAWPDSNGNGMLDGSEGSALLTQLEQCRQLIVTGGVGPDSRVFLYGWIKGNPMSYNGLSTVPGQVAFGNTEAVRYQRTFAHELGHDFGFNHDTDSIGEVGWDVGGRLAVGPAGNNVAADGRIKPSDLKDIMYAGLLTNQAWIEKARYEDLYNNPVLATAPDKSQASKDYLFIQGQFDPAGQQLAKRLSVFRYPWPIPPPPPPPDPEKARYSAVVTNAQGEVAKVGFNALVSAPEEKTLSHGAFEVPVKLAGDIAEVQIIDNQSGTVLTDRKAAGKPSIRITSPDSGSKLGEKTEISWEAQFGVPADQVEYQVAYSPDNGETFVPLAVGISGDTRKITVNTREISKSAGTGLIRVFLSDGLTTTYADITKLTTTAAIY
jgi:hypothetical protein